MVDKLKRGGIYLFQILLTALASALLAVLQDYIARHTGANQIQINPAQTGQIGAVLGSARVAYIHFKTFC